MEPNNNPTPDSENLPDKEVKSKEELKFSFKSFLQNFIAYFNSVVSIRSEVDFSGSVESIKKDIDFKGVSVWILGASIVVASVGLNVNSTAVVIGAMLISPLMGPIVGTGLAIGINDFQLLTRSLRSLATAVVISVLISALYFAVTPFGEVQSELIARTRPNLLDVIIAIFGGMALIVAKTQRGTVASVIFGVAIATALMPPLCTAGYGLANGNWQFFFGAFYLFLINSTFIALSTFIIVKYLRFPLATYIDPAKQKRVRNSILIISIAMIVPSSITFWSTIQESIFERDANVFIIENFAFEGSEVINKKIDYKDGDNALIEVFVIGELISEKVERELNTKLAQYDLTEATLKIHQSKDKTSEIAGQLSAQVKSGIIEDLYERNETILKDKDDKIAFLESKLRQYRTDTIPFTAIKKELKVQHKEIASLSYGNTISTDFENKQDTIPIFYVRWNNNLSKEAGKQKTAAVEAWLQVRIKKPKARVFDLTGL